MKNKASDVTTEFVREPSLSPHPLKDFTIWPEMPYYSKFLSFLAPLRDKLQEKFLNETAPEMKRTSLKQCYRCSTEQCKKSNLFYFVQSLLRQNVVGRTFISGGVIRGSFFRAPINCAETKLRSSCKKNF